MASIVVTQEHPLSLFDYPIWKDDGVQLRDFKYKKQYLTPEQYIDPNPLSNLVVPPGIENFFGTKVCNIFIIAQPYGWTQSGSTWNEDWPPPGLEAAKARHMAMYNQFTWYESHMYMDYNLVNTIMDMNPDSKFREMMDSTRTHISALCDELTQYGFILEDDINDPVDASFFQDTIDLFYRASNLPQS